MELEEDHTRRGTWLVIQFRQVRDSYDGTVCRLYLSDYWANYWTDYYFLRALSLVKFTLETAFLSSITTERCDVERNHCKLDRIEAVLHIPPRIAWGSQPRGP